MSLCARCQQSEAVVHVEAVVNGKKTATDLCQVCAQKTGIGLGGPAAALSFPSLSPLLADLLGMLSHWNPPPAASACPRCRWTLGHFRRTGKMGCPDCYTHFRATAQDVLSRIHGSAVHKGRRPPAFEENKPKAKDKKEGLSDLKAQLAKAVRAERFEEAAGLRDRIRQLEAPAE